MHHMQHTFLNNLMRNQNSVFNDNSFLTLNIKKTLVFFTFNINNNKHITIFKT